MGNRENILWLSALKLSSQNNTTKSNVKPNTRPPSPAQRAEHHGEEKKCNRIEPVLHEAKLMRPQHNHRVVVRVLSQDHQMKIYPAFKKCPGDWRFSDLSG